RQRRRSGGGGDLAAAEIAGLLDELAAADLAIAVEQQADAIGRAVAQGLLLGDEENALQGLRAARGLLALEQVGTEQNKESGQEGDEEDHHQQLDQREGRSASRAISTRCAHGIPSTLLLPLPPTPS